jgi:poly(A) polymerase
MASTGEKPLGITAPLSTSLPTDAENQSSNALIEELKKQNNYESVADTQKRYAGIANLNTNIRGLVVASCKLMGLI